jgi:MerR family transcriptional regulator, light-induced transcriptional regulator
MNTTNNHIENAFKIGAVSKMTNIPVDTLRIWERRYSVVVPVRSKNADRLYQTKDISRLTLLKMLVDKGHSIGSIAHLNNDELSKRLEVHDNNLTAKKSSFGKSVNIVVIGEVLSIQLQHTPLNDTSFSFTGIFRNEKEFIEHTNNENVDILIIEYPAIHEDNIESIENLFHRSGAKHLILIYGFTNSAAKKILDQTSYQYIQAPIKIDNLQREISDLIKDKNISDDKNKIVDLDNKAPTRTYNNKHLIGLSSTSSVIKCECPQHLSSMIIKLVQFEVYSNECITRYEKDAELHAMLGNMAGHARSILEQALTKVVEAEKLTLE